VSSEIVVREKLAMPHRNSAASAKPVQLDALTVPAMLSFDGSHDARVMA